jgi:hypothetical protein
MQRLCPLPFDLAREARIGAPGRTRTCDPRLRRPVLYPTELRARSFSVIRQFVFVLCASKKSKI